MSRFILLCLISFSAYAQTTVQPPPASSVPWFGIALAIVLIAFCVIIYFWYRRHGGAELVQSAMNRAESEVSSLTRKVEPAIAQPAAATPAPAASSAPAPLAPAAPGPATALADQSGWVLCPKTGHKVPPPVGDAANNEGLANYYVRVSPYIGGHGLADAGGLMQEQSDLHTVNDGNPANWPFIVDEYANRAAYLTDAEKADAAALQARDQNAANQVFDGVFPAAALTLPDVQYLLSMAVSYKTATGREIYRDMLYGPWITIRQWLSDAGNAHTSETSRFDPATYTGPLRGLVEGRMAGR